MGLICIPSRKTLSKNTFSCHMLGGMSPSGYLFRGVPRPCWFGGLQDHWLSFHKPPKNKWWYFKSFPTVLSCFSYNFNLTTPHLDPDELASKHFQSCCLSISLSSNSFQMNQLYSKWPRNSSSNCFIVESTDCCPFDHITHSLVLFKQFPNNLKRICSSSINFLIPTWLSNMSFGLMYYLQLTTGSLGSSN